MSDARSLEDMTHLNVEDLSEDEIRLIEKTDEAGREHIRILASSHGLAIALCDTSVYVDESTLFEAGAYFVNFGAIEEDEDGTLYSCSDDESFELFKELLLSLFKKNETHFDDDEIRKISVSEMPFPEAGRALTLHDVLLLYTLRDAESDEERERFLSALESLNEREKKVGDAAAAVDENGTEESLIPRQHVSPIRMQHVPISKVAHNLTSANLFSEAGALLDVAGRGEKRAGKAIKTQVALFMDEGVELSTKKPLKELDTQLIAACSSLMRAGNTTVSIADIAKALGIKRPGNSKKALTEIERRVDFMRTVNARIDYSDEARRNKLLVDNDEVSDFDLEGHLLEARKIRIKTVNGKTVKGYEFLKEPILAQHAELIGQVATYKQSLLSIGEGSDTLANVMIKRDILTRVSQLKNKRSSISSVMRYDTLLDKAGVNFEDRDARKRAQDFACSVLEDLKKLGEIRDYREKRESQGGRPKRVSVEIVV